MRAADQTFVSLADVLRGEAVSGDVAPESAAVALPEQLPAASADHAELARDVRLFRARLADAFEAARDALLRELAYAVLGRELVLAPCDIANIALRLLAAHPSAQPVRLRVAPDDAAALEPCAGALPPVASDAGLAPGDAILELAGGQIDARLGMRLATLLENAP